MQKNNFDATQATNFLNNHRLVEYLNSLGHPPSFSTNEIYFYAPFGGCPNQTLMIYNEQNLFKACLTINDANVIDLAMLLSRPSPAAVLANPAAYHLDRLPPNNTEPRPDDTDPKIISIHHRPKAKPSPNG